VIGGNALVVELYMRIFSLADTNGIVVFEDGTVRRLVVRLLELELNYALVDVLNTRKGTFLMMSTLNSTSYESCTNC
jgi:hypothetical protein